MTNHFFSFMFALTFMIVKTPQLRYEIKQLDITISEFPLHNLHQLDYPIKGTIKKKSHPIIVNRGKSIIDSTTCIVSVHLLQFHLRRWGTKGPRGPSLTPTPFGGSTP